MQSPATVLADRARRAIAAGLAARGFAAEAQPNQPKLKKAVKFRP